MDKKLLETTSLCVEIMNSKRQVKGNSLQLKFVIVFLALKCLKIQTFRVYCPFISGRCRYTERASFYSNVATFEARAGRVRSNKIEVNV